MHPVVQFVVFALLIGLAIWVLGQFPMLDATVAKLIRIVLLVVLALMFINLVLILIVGRGLPGYLTGAGA